MHPILLCTLLFLPGIKSSNELQAIAQKEKTISKTGIAPFQESNNDKINIISSVIEEKRDLKPYESHIAKKFNKVFEPGKSLQYLLSIHRDVDNAIQQDSSFEHKYYITTPKNKDELNIKKKHRKDLEKRQQKEKREEKIDRKLIKKYKETKIDKYRQNKHDEKGKRFNKAVKKEFAKFEKHLLEYPASKEGKHKKFEYIDNKKHIKYDQEKKKRKERVKRQTESSEESDESTDHDEPNVESSFEKSLLEHMFGFGMEDSQPFKDIIEVDIKKTNIDENGKRMPVVEEEIKKKVAYVSCNEANGLLCNEMKKPNSYEVNVEQHNHQKLEEKKKDENEYHHDELDENWTRLLEESIIKIE